MLDALYLKDLLHQGVLSKTQKLLLCLAVDGAKAKSVSEIRKIARAGGLHSVKNWNVSLLLSRSKGGAVRTDNGWELNAAGKKAVSELAGPYIASSPPPVASTLRAELVKIKDADTKAFVQEAISCFEGRLCRAAVVLSWVGAVSVLYEHVIVAKLVAFNAVDAASAGAVVPALGLADGESTKPARHAGPRRRNRPPLVASAPSPAHGLPKAHIDLTRRCPVTFARTLVERLRESAAFRLDDLGTHEREEERTLVDQCRPSGQL